MKSGFSMIEMIIVLGIGSVVAAGIYSIMSQLTDQQAALDGKMDLKVMANELRPRLENGATCITTFANTFRYNPTEAARVSPLGQSITGGLALPNGERLTPGTALARYALLVTDVKLTNAVTVAPNTYQVQVEGHLRARKGKQLPYSPELFTTLTLVTGPGNQLVSCNGALGGGPGGAGPPTLQSAQATCESVGGNWYSSTCNFCNGSVAPFGFDFIDGTPPRILAKCPNDSSSGN